MTSFLQPLARAGAVAALFLAAFAGAAHAGGTPADTKITNSATLEFKIGNVVQDKICSSLGGNSDFLNCTDKQTVFTVDNKIDVLVTVKNGVAIEAVPGGTAYVEFEVTNKGNLAQTLGLAWFNASSVTFGSTTHTDTLNPTSCVIQDNAGATIPNDRSSFAIDQVKTVRVSCTFPTLNGSVPFTLTDYAIVGLRATAVNTDGTNLTASTSNTAGVDILFADGQGKYNDDALRDAAYTDRGAFNMKPALLSVSKAVATLCDPTTGDATSGKSPRNIPGAIVRYTITVKNAANASTASMTTISDTLSSALLFDKNFVTGADVSGAPNCSSGSGVATSGTGKGVRVTVTGGLRTTSYPKFLDSGLVENNQVITFSGASAWSTALPAEGSEYLQGDLKAGETLTLEFNATIQ